MQQGWNAEGKLTPLYERHGGREQLAAKTGVPVGTLSRINSGKGRMGDDVAERIAAALQISVLDLGAPAEKADGNGRPVLDRLEELATKLGDVVEHQLRTDAEMQRLDDRIRRLEVARGAGGDVATDLA